MLCATCFMHYLCTLWHALPHMLLCALLTSVHAVHTCLGAYCLVCPHALPISVRQLLSRPILCTKLASLVTSTLLAITTHANFPYFSERLHAHPHCCPRLGTRPQTKPRHWPIWLEAVTPIL